MRRFIIASFFGVCIIFLNFNAYAIQMNISVEGTVLDNASDVLGWGGEPFMINYTIDSEKAPYDSVESDTPFVRRYYYYPDTATFIVGTQAQSFDTAWLSFSKVVDEDQIRLRITNNTDDWEYDTLLRFNFCYLGSEYPIPPSTVFSLEDAFGIDGTIADISGITPTELYDITIAKAESAPVPEPATMLLLGSGLLGIAGFGRRKFFKK